MSKHLDFADEILATGSEIFYISTYAEDDKEQFIREFSGLLSRGYDIVHIHTKYWKSCLVEEICKTCHVPKIVIHSHNIGIDILDPVKRDEDRKKYEYIKEQITEDMATDFWACSKAAADFLFGEQIPREKIKIMPNAIDVDKFAYDQHIREQYREKYGLQDCFVIGHVGRFAYQKNHRFLVDAFKEITKKIDDARLVLLGDGELFSEIQEQVKGYGLTDKVTFVGKTDDVAGWYQAMDVFCLPSRFEGLGIVLIEAQTAGLKCLTSTDVPAETHITENIIYLPLEISRWVDAVVDLKKGYHRTDMKGKIRGSGYDISEVIKKIERIYTQ